MSRLKAPNHINVYEAKAHLSKLIRQVEKSGRPITLCRGGKPVVDLVPHPRKKNPLAPDPALAGAVFSGDPCAPVGEADWPAELR